MQAGQPQKVWGVRVAPWWRRVRRRGEEGVCVQQVSAHRAQQRACAGKMRGAGVHAPRARVPVRSAARQN